MLAVLGAVTGDDRGIDAATRHPRPVDIVPFEAWHLQWLTLQASQDPTWVPLTYDYGLALKTAGPCHTAFVGASVIACAGIVRYWEGRAAAWALLSDQMPEYRKAIHKAVKAFLAGFECRRLDDGGRAVNPLPCAPAKAGALCRRPLSAHAKAQRRKESEAPASAFRRSRQIIARMRGRTGDTMGDPRGPFASSRLRVKQTTAGDHR